MSLERVSWIDGVGIGCLAGLGAVAWALGVNPVFAARAAEAERRQAIMDVEAEMMSQEQGVLRLKAELGSARAALSASRVRLLGVGELNQRVGRLAKAATEAGLKVEQITPGEASTKGRVATVPVRLVARSTFASACAFLWQLHDEFPDVAVEAMRLDAGPEDKPGTVQPGALDLRIIWHASADSTAGAASGTAAGGAGRASTASADQP